MKQDYYADLGIAKTASEAEIKNAYRQLVREHHPDKQGDPIKFRAVAEAYRCGWRMHVQYEYLNGIGTNPIAGGYRYSKR
jgi:hypothetical protein